MQHSSIFRTRWLLAALVWSTLLPSCQSSRSTDSSEPTPTSERTRVVVVYSIKASEPYKFADSLTWSASTQSGAGLVPRLSDSTSASRAYAATIPLKSPLKNGPLTLSLWLHGIRLLQVDYVAAGSTDTLQIVSGSVQADSVALALLRGLDSLASAYPQTRAGLLALYADWLLAADLRVEGFPDSLPVGFTASEVIGATLVAASRTGKTLAEQAKTWSLDLSVDSATVITLELIASKTITAKDSSSLFPPPPVRVKTPLAVGSGLRAGGASVNVGGAFTWDDGLGLVALQGLLTRDGKPDTNLVVYGLPVPASADRAVVLDGNASLLAKASAPAGTYVLTITAQDGAQHTASSSDTFEVAAKLPDQPAAPRIRLLSPADKSTVPFETADVVTTWIATTPQGSVDSVKVDGTKADKINDSTWQAKVRLEPTGKSRTIVAKVVNNAGLEAVATLELTRQADAAGPVVTWVSPLEDLEVDNAVTAFTVRIKAVDPSGIDTVLIAGSKPDSLTAAGEYVRKVPLVTTGSPIAIAVRVVDSARNATTSSKSITRANPATDVPPKAVLLEPAAKTGTVVPFETKSVTVRWQITDPYWIDSSSVTINGKPAKSEGNDKWSAVVDLEAGAPTTILLVVKNKNGVSGGDVASVTRQADTSPPNLSWTAGGRSVGFDSAEVLVGVKASDNDSLVAVTIGGLIATANGDTYAAKLKLEVGDNPIVAIATDRTGLKDTLRAAIHRYQKLSIQRVAPSGSDTTVGSTSGPVVLSWKVSGAKSVGVGDSLLTASGGLYAWTAAATAAGTRVVLWALDSAGKRDSSPVTVTRRGKTALTLSYGKDTLLTLPDSVVIAATTEVGATLAWSLDGTTWTPFTGSFVQKASGTAQVRAQLAGKEETVASLKAFDLHSYPVAIITREASTKDSSVASTASSITLGWKVTGAKTVKIAGSPVTATNGIFSSTIPLATGANGVKIEATDSAGRTVSDSVTITRRALASLTLSYGEDTSSTLPDSVVIQAVSEAGATLAWSLDGTTWTAFTESFAQKASGTAQVRAKVAGKDDNILSLKAFTLYHLNHAPTIALTSSGLLVKSYLGTFSAGVVKVTDWGAGDDIQTATYRVQMFDLADTQFVASLSVNSQGQLSGTLRIDTSVTLKVRIRAKDNGGTSGGGVDTSAWSAWLLIQIVDTVLDPSLNSYRAIRMPDGKTWMRSNLRYQVQVPGESCKNDSCEKYGVQYSQTTAFINGTSSSPTQSLCPTSWHLADKTEWQNLFISTMSESSSDSLYALKAPGQWNSCFQGCTIDPASGAYGDFLVPNGTYAMYGAELWVWMPRDHKTISTEGAYALKHSSFNSAPPVAAIRCVKD